MHNIVSTIQSRRVSYITNTYDLNNNTIHAILSLAPELTILRKFGVHIYWDNVSKPLKIDENLKT